MKNLTLTIAVLVCSFGYGQDFIASMPEYNLIYRGYNNKVILGALDYKGNFKIEGDGCSISKIEGNTYSVRASSERTATIKFVNDKRQVLDSVVFRVSNLPTPSLFLCSTEGNGHNKSSVSCRKLFVKYPANVALSVNSDSWRIINLSAMYNNEDLGSFEVDQLSKLFDTINKRIRDSDEVVEAQLKIRTKISGPDGIVRMVSGQWVLLPPTTTYYENGQVESEISYDESGYLNGSCKYYYENGQLLKELHYDRNGSIANEKIVIYYAGGTIMSEEDLKTMEYLSYHENGEIESQGRLAVSTDGGLDLTQHGKWKYFNSKGKLDCTIEYDWGLVNEKSGKCSTVQ